MKLSVIIPCYNDATTIAVQLEALVKQQWSEPWEVIVSDNGSTDNTLDIVEQYKDKLPNLKVIDSSDRRGPAHARNIAASIAIGEALAFCDADDEVAPGWVAVMGETLMVHDFIAGRLDTEKLNEPWTRHGSPQRDGLQEYTYPPYLPHAACCNIGIKRSLHEALGGFDESLLRLQDTDYCWRAQRSGAKLHFEPKALVHWRFRATLLGIYRQERNYAEYNVLLYKRYRSLDMPRLTWRNNFSVILSYLKIIKHFMEVSNKTELARCMVELGYRIGRLKGSLKYRVLAL